MVTCWWASYKSGWKTIFKLSNNCQLRFPINKGLLQSRESPTLNLKQPTELNKHSSTLDFEASGLSSSWFLSREKIGVIKEKMAC